MSPRAALQRDTRYNLLAMAQQVADLGVLAGRIAVVTGGALHQPPTAPRLRIGALASAAGARSSAAVLRPRAHHLTMLRIPPAPASVLRVPAPSI